VEKFIDSFALADMRNSFSEVISSILPFLNLSSSCRNWKS